MYRPETKVITTKKMLFIYSGENLVGAAGVKRAKDFDYDTLLAIAKQGSKLKEEV